MEVGVDSDKCDSCHTPFGIRRLKKREYKRRVIDPITNKLLVMCNACGLRLSRAGWKNRKEDINTTITTEKEICAINVELFLKAVGDVLQDNNVMRLCCPVVSPKLCQCIQRYLITEGQQIQHKSKDKSIDIVINKERAAELYELHRKAKELIKMKVPRPNNKALSSSEIRGVVHLRTKEYEEFVLLNRERLKKLCNLCERGVQRVLCYSNNYLHKQLKTSPNGEARIAGKSTLVAKQLPNITTLFERKCCNRRCTRLSITHGRLLERWRERALLGQRDARAVLAEMLTPAGGAVNCCTFLHLVTGCSPGLLSKVKKEMKQSAGIREPPEHGLREYWRRKKINAARSQENNSNDEYNDPGEGISFIKEWQ